MSVNSRSRGFTADYIPLVTGGYELVSDEEHVPRRCCRADYETAIEAAGHGKFHYWLLLVCGWANAADAVEILCVSFLLPSAECDLRMTSADKGLLSGMVFLGMMIGGYVWGTLGDSLGRKQILVASMILNSFFAIFSSISMDFPTFLTLRFISGLGVGGSIPLTWSYFIEFQSKVKRGSMLSFLASFWMIGNIIVAGLAWIIIPRTFEYVGPNFRFNSWRLFTAICGLPSLSVAICLLFFPESPRYLLSVGNEEKALLVFRRIFVSNTRQSAERYPYTNFVLDDDMIRVNYQRSVSLVDRLKTTLKQVLSQTRAVFTSSLIKPMILMVVINFTIQFGYYGLWFWFPELFNRLENFYRDNPNVTASVCQVVNYKADNSTDEDPFMHCKNPTPPSSEVFINAFIVALAPLPANIWTIYHMDKLGRKFFLVFSMVMSGLSAFLIWFDENTTGNLVLSCIFGAVSTMGFNALDCLGAELFPTGVRSTSMAITMAAARLGAILGNIVFGLIVDVNCAIPILLVSGLLIGGSLFGLLLPNTTKEPLI